MTAAPVTTPPPEPLPLRRDPARARLGGVAAGLARRLGIHPVPVRIGFVVATLAGGWGALLYLLLWATLPASEDAAGAPSRFRTGRSAVEVGLGAALLLLAALLLARQAGLWSSDALVWPLALVAGGGALLWRQSLAGGVEDGDLPLIDAPPAERRARRAAMVSRTSLGVALVLGAGVAFLYFTGALSAARDVVLAALAVAVVLAVIFAPFITRLVGALAEERSRRVREQERAEMAAHLHDSVLQTLALMQQRAEDPREVATLARSQERELRAWLAGRGHVGIDAVRETLAGALEAAADEVEALHRVPVEVVAVGEVGLDERGKALVAAAREAMVNAAKHGGPEPVRVFAEADDGAVTVYVRDRGAGFDPAAVPPDRRGVRDSIIGRMSRHGGHATISSTPDAGTEVELVLPRESP
jgi:signal transduction histidine kinase/phage shock protein PspC (stress-responsive transcriptional regulator)